MDLKLQEKLLKAIGQSGVKLTIVQGTKAISASMINALTDSVIVVKVDWANAGATETLSLDKGQTVYGNFTEATVTSGTVVAY